MALALAVAYYNKGDNYTAALDLKPDENRVSVSLDRSYFSELPKESVATVQLWYSYDKINWIFSCECYVEGGDAYNGKGERVTVSEMTGCWIPGRGKPRSIRACLVAKRRMKCYLEVTPYVGADMATWQPPGSVAFAAANSWGTSGVTGATQSITVADQADDVLMAFTGVDDNELSDPSPTVTYNSSETLSQIATKVQNGGGAQDLHCFVHRRVAPTATTANLVWAGMQTGHRWFYGYAHFYNVDQATPENTPTTNGASTGDTHTGSDTGVTDGMGVGFCACLRTGSPTISDNGSQTNRTEYEGAGGRVAGSVSTLTGTGTLSFSWTSAGSTIQAWAVIVAVLNPATGTVYNDAGADGAKAGDSAVVVITMSPDGADGAKFGDTPGNQLTISPAGADGAKLGDTGTNLMTMGEAVTDGSLLGDTGTNLMTMGESVDDGAVLGDAGGGGLLLTEDGADGVLGGDAAVVYISVPVAGADGVTMGDVSASLMEMVAAALDGIAAGDLGASIAQLGLSAADAVLVGDTGSVTQDSSYVAFTMCRDSTHLRRPTVKLRWRGDIFREADFDVSSDQSSADRGEVIFKVHSRRRGYIMHFLFQAPRAGAPMCRLRSIAKVTGAGRFPLLQSESVEDTDARDGTHLVTPSVSVRLSSDTMHEDDFGNAADPSTVRRAVAVHKVSALRKGRVVHVVFRSPRAGAPFMRLRSMLKVDDGSRFRLRPDKR